MGPFNTPNGRKGLVLVCVIVSTVAIFTLLNVQHQATTLQAEEKQGVSQNNIIKQVKKKVYKARIPKYKEEHAGLSQQKKSPKVLRRKESPITETVEQRKKIPLPLVGLVENMDELKGKHSDFIMPNCGNQTGLPSKTNKKYDFLGPFNYLGNYKNPCWVDNNEEIQCVPYFYLIGCPKCGSTDVYWRLNEHPDVYTGRAKEIRWFDILRFSNQVRGLKKNMTSFQDFLDFYTTARETIKRGFRGANTTEKGQHYRVFGDGSPTYYYDSYAWKLLPGNEGCTEPRVTVMSHIHHLWPEAKLIMVLRNPVTRLFSTYLYNEHLPGYNKTAAQFDEWIRQSLDIWYNCVGREPIRACLYHEDIHFKARIRTITAGMYSRYILDLLKIFPREQLYIVQMEQYSNNITETIRDMLNFLELPKLSEPELQRITAKRQQNKGRNYADVPEMWPSTRRLLEYFFAPFNAEMAAIMGDNRWLYKPSTLPS